MKIFTCTVCISWNQTHNFGIATVASVAISYGNMFISYSIYFGRELEIYFSKYQNDPHSLKWILRLYVSGSTVFTGQKLGDG